MSEEQPAVFDQGPGRMATSKPPQEGGRYFVNEVFYSLQGEGKRAGAASVFVRFGKCNLKCTIEPSDKSPGGFDCDTEFESGRWLTLEELRDWIFEEGPKAGGAQGDPRLGDALPCWLVLTGGEPGLQVDERFCNYFHALGYLLAIETNGSVLLPVNCGGHRIQGEPTEHCLACFAFDWITVSPKVAEHAIRQRWAHEVKYVRGYGQAIPDTVVEAAHQLISPAFLGLEYDPRAIQWCIDLVKQNPDWELSMQQHKLWLPGGGVR